jgi:hypothetical protein
MERNLFLISSDLMVKITHLMVIAITYLYYSIEKGLMLIKNQK